MIPIGDAPNPPGFRAWVTWLLIAANVAVYALVTLPLGLVQPSPDDPLLRAYVDVIARELPSGVPLEVVLRSLTAYDLLVFEWGYKPGAPEWRDLLASLFLHAGLLHLGGNMLFLWIYGDNVEHRLGRLLYLVAYVGSGVAATLGYAALAGGSMTPLVGASGAISGVLGLYFVLFPRNQVRLLVFLFFIIDVWVVPARLVLALYVVLDNLLPLLGGAEAGVAYGAHLGGFAAGAVLAVAGERLNWRWPWTDRVAGRAERRPEARPALVEAVERGDRDRALSSLPHVAPADLDALSPAQTRRLAGWLQDAGHHVAAVRLLRRAVKRMAAGTERARLHLALGRIFVDEGEPATAVRHLGAALQEQPDRDTRLEVRALLEQLGLPARYLPG